jgi:hypothetical protein
MTARNPISLNLYDPVLYGNGTLGNFTDPFRRTWRRSIRRRGGFYAGTIELTEADLTRRELEEFFRYGLLREIREMGGGAESWRGALMKMEYTKGSQLFTTDITRMSNAVKVIYTRIFENLLTNGSGESGVWATYGTATVTQTTTWKSDGTYSIRIQTAGGINGAVIQTIIPIVAGQTYTIEGRLNLVAGSLRASCNRVDNDQSLCFFSTHGGAAGDYHVSMSIPTTNTYTGNANLRITSEASAIDVYADGFSMRQTPIANTQTGWYEDSNSIAINGRKENVILEIGKTSAAANAEAASWLSRWSWPVPYPPNNYQSLFLDAKALGDKLMLTFAGYWATLNWLNVPLGIDTGTISALMTSLVSQQSTYLTIGTIDTNTTDYAIDNRGSLLIGDVIRDMAGDGQAGGALYEAGVYTNRKFEYRRVTDELIYHIKGGNLYSVSDSPYEPWLARPGYALWQDLPIGPPRQKIESATYTALDPRIAYLEEIEMLADGRLIYRLEPTL